eukprot:2583234-Amphidinium_carterae.1
MSFITPEQQGSQHTYCFECNIEYGDAPIIVRSLKTREQIVAVVGGVPLSLGCVVCQSSGLDAMETTAVRNCDPGRRSASRHAVRTIENP